MKHTILVKTCLGNVVYSGETKLDATKFSVRNQIRTRMQLKYGPSIRIEFITSQVG